MDDAMLMLRDGGPVMGLLVLAVPPALVAALVLAGLVLARFRVPVVAFMVPPLAVAGLGLAGTWHGLVLLDQVLANAASFRAHDLARAGVSLALYPSIAGQALAALVLVASAWLLAVAGVARAGANARMTPLHAVCPTLAALLAAGLGFAVDGLLTAGMALAGGLALAVATLRVAPEGEDAARLAAGRVAVCWMVVLAMLGVALGRSLTWESWLHDAIVQYNPLLSGYPEVPWIDGRGGLAAAGVLSLGGLVAAAPVARHLGGRRSLVSSGAALLALLPLLLLGAVVEGRKQAMEAYFTPWWVQEGEALAEMGIDLPVADLPRGARPRHPVVLVRGSVVLVDGEEVATLERPDEVVEALARAESRQMEGQRYVVLHGDGGEAGLPPRLVADRGRTLDELRPLLRVLREGGKDFVMLGAVREGERGLWEVEINLEEPAGGSAPRLVVQGRPGAWQVAGLDEPIGDLDRLKGLVYEQIPDGTVDLWIEGPVTVQELVHVLEALTLHHPSLLLDAPGEEP